MRTVASLGVASSIAMALVGCSGDRLVLGGGGDSGCVPGLYVGSYTCTQDGAAPLSPQGPLSLVLQGDLGASSLTIAAGTTLSGSASGTNFVMPLTGSLDCTATPHVLHGTLGDVDFTATGTHLTIHQAVPMTARYDADASPPGLVDGTWTEPQYQTLLGGPCEWSAQLQP
jgi:hypothetical protein